MKTVEPFAGAEAIGAKIDFFSAHAIVQVPNALANLVQKTD